MPPVLSAEAVNLMSPVMPAGARAVPAASATAEGWGMPQDRHARIAARRSFVALKHRFMAAAGEIDGPRADWLRAQVRQAEEPVDLWLLRGLVDDALRREGPAAERCRTELRALLTQVFPDSGELLPYGAQR